MIYFILIFYTIALLLFVLWCFQYVVTLFYGAPYVKSSDTRTSDIISLLKPKPGEKIIDLGSGDGKLLFEIAKYGSKAYGIEINPVLVWRTKRKIKTSKSSQNINVKRGNFFNENLSKYDAVVIYGITYIMPKLEQKLRKELKPGARVVSSYFALPQWSAVKKRGDVLLYQK